MRKICLFFLLGMFLTACASKAKEYPVIRDPGYQKAVKVVKEEPDRAVKKKDESVVDLREPKKVEKKKIIDIGQVPLRKPVVPDIPDIRVYFPDPTKGYIQNRTYNIFIKVWLDPDFGSEGDKGEPDFYLPPKAIDKAIMPLGDHIVYAEGLIKTQYGWESVGVTSEEISIDHRVYYGGHYGWYVEFNQSDFQR